MVWKGLLARTRGKTREWVLLIHRVFNHLDCQEVGCLCLGSFLLSVHTIQHG